MIWRNKAFLRIAPYCIYWAAVDKGKATHITSKQQSHFPYYFWICCVPIFCQSNPKKRRKQEKIKRAIILCLNFLYVDAFYHLHWQEQDTWEANAPLLIHSVQIFRCAMCFQADVKPHDFKNVCIPNSTEEKKNMVIIWQKVTNNNIEFHLTYIEAHSTKKMHTA